MRADWHRGKIVSLVQQPGWKRRFDCHTVGWQSDFFLPGFRCSFRRIKEITKNEITENKKIFMWVRAAWDMCTVTGNTGTCWKY